MSPTTELTVWTGPDDPAKIQSLINVLRATARFAILESLADIGFPKPEQEEILLNVWPKGRIFCEEFELRWEKREEVWTSVFAAEPKHAGITAAEKSGFTVNVLKSIASGDLASYYLWDPQNARLGRRLKYECIPDYDEKLNESPLLVVQEYRNPLGELVFWRYVKLRKEDEPV